MNVDPVRQRIQELEAELERLRQLATQASGPPDLSGPAFTPEQLADAKFVREHAEEIRQAARQGRLRR